MTSKQTVFEVYAFSEATLRKEDVASFLLSEDADEVCFEYTDGRETPLVQYLITANPYFQARIEGDHFVMERSIPKHTKESSGDIFYPLPKWARTFEDRINRYVDKHESITFGQALSMLRKCK